MFLGRERNAACVLFSFVLYWLFQNQGWIGLVTAGREGDGGG
jgi:hypothetical protein